MFDSTSRAPARKPIAACMAAIFSLAAPAAMAATTWTVNTCDEANVGSGTIGSLRYAATHALPNDIVDMTTIGCSTISLSTGSVVFVQPSITLNGPGEDALTITSSNDRVLTHANSGAFMLNDFTVANGYLHPSSGTRATGGCITSTGKVYLSHVGVHSCRAAAVGNAAYGGGVYGRDLVFAKYSDISGNTASASGTFGTRGGGIASYRDVFIASSTVSGNNASGGAGGGIRAFQGNVTVVGSTISGNTASNAGGISQVYASNSSNAMSFTLHNSTVSSNSASGYVGGAWTNAGTIEVKNSTVASNTAGHADTGFGILSPGFAVSDTGVDFTTDPGNPKVKVVTLQSSVFSNNAYGIPATIADDFGVAHFASAPPGSNTTPTSGQNNLVFATQLLGLQNTMTTGVCPRLGPLRDNGGPTKTRALLSGSPAIDHGNNTHPYPTDQRGLPRPLNGTADIGAYEVQQADIIFNNGHEGCG